MLIKSEGTHNMTPDTPLHAPHRTTLFLFTSFPFFGFFIENVAAFVSFDYNDAEVARGQLQRVRATSETSQTFSR